MKMITNLKQNTSAQPEVQRTPKAREFRERYPNGIGTIVDMRAVMK